MGNIVGDCFLKETVSRAYKPGKIQLVEKMSQLTCFFCQPTENPTECGNPNVDTSPTAGPPSLGTCTPMASELHKQLCSELR